MPGTGRTDGPEALADVIAAVVDDLGGRLRRFGTRQWREPIGSAGESAADLVHALVVACATVAAELSGDLPPGAPLAPERPPYDAALADRLAVVGRDLALATAAHADDRAVAAVLAGLLVGAKDLRLPRDPACVRRVAAILGVFDSDDDLPNGDVDVLLERLCLQLPGLRRLRLGEVVA